MFSMDVRSTHSMAHVRREARRYFVEELGMEQEETGNNATLFFTEGDGFVRVELVADDPSRVVLHSRDRDQAVRDFATLIS